MTTPAAAERFRVVIAGGGVAGVEAMLALARLAPELVDVKLLAPTDEFVDRSMLVAEPFGSSEATRLDLAALAAEADAQHVRAALARVDAAAHTIATTDGQTLPYDALLVALGTTPVSAVPGAIAFGEEDGRRRFADLLSVFGRPSATRLAFVVPHGVSWSIAAYELALLTAAERDARRLDGTELVLVTHESEPLRIFGTAASRLVAAKLEEAGIGLRPGSVADRFEQGELRLATGESLAADAAVSLPSLQVSPIPGLPQDRHGFVRTDAAMNAAGYSDVWAAGDVTSFPIKQGGLAAQQADVAARSIAVRAGARVPIEPFRPVLRAALITGGAPEFLRTTIGDAEHGSAASGRALWWPPRKTAGRYIGPHGYAAHAGAGDELEDVRAPRDPAAGAKQHDRAIYLVLAAAEDDAAAGNYERALKWLALVEELNLVIPPEYVARRHNWRLHLDPGSSPDPAAKRIDPRFESAAGALSDLERRIGSLRRSEAATEHEMREHLAVLDRGLAELHQLSRLTGVEPAKRDDA